MRPIFLFVLTSVSFVTCTSVLFLHLNNLHPSRLAKPVWPRIYQEIIAPIKEHLPTLFTENSALDIITEWIRCLFQGSKIRLIQLLSSKDDDTRFEEGELIYPNTPLYKENGGLVLAKAEGFVLSRAVMDQGTHNEKILALVHFDPKMPPYDVCDVLRYFEKHKIPIPSIMRVIPERVFYHPNYSPQPPFDSSNLVFYITGMLNQILVCICAHKTKVLTEFTHKMNSIPLTPEVGLLVSLWHLLIPYTESKVPKISGRLNIRSLKTGEIIPFKWCPSGKAVTICTAKEMKIKSSGPLLAILPRHVVATPMEGYKLLEYFYAQKFYDYALGKRVKEVEVLTGILIQRFLTYYNIFGNAVGNKQMSEIILPGAIHTKQRTKEMLESECRRHSQNISTRFESAAVRRKVHAQYHDEFCKWMSPDVPLHLLS